MTRSKLEGPELLLLLPAAAFTGSFLTPFWQQTGLSAQGLLLGSMAGYLPLWALLGVYCRRVGRGRSRLFDGSLWAALVLSAAWELLRCQRFYLYVLGSHLPLFWFLAIALALAAYSRSLSEGTLGRAAQITLVFLAFSLLLVLISASGQMHTVRLRCAPAAEAGIGQGAKLRLALLPEYLLLPVLTVSSARKSHWRHQTAWLLGTVFALDALLLIASELVLGPAAGQLPEPVYTLARLGGISVFRRMDALHICTWLMLFYLKISLYFWAMGKLWETTRRPGKGAAFAVNAAVVLLVFGLIRSVDGHRVLQAQQVLLWLLLLVPMGRGKGGRSTSKPCG